MSTEEEDQLAREQAKALRASIHEADPDTLRLLLTEARTYNGWLDKPVSTATLEQLYRLAAWGPTSANGQPARYVFVHSAEAREKLLPALASGNVNKVKKAPITVIVAYDTSFWKELPRLFPVANMSGLYQENPERAQIHAFRNGTLQGAYLIIAARALGLDCGPMSGFDEAKVNESFFAGTSWQVNFLCNLGYGDPNTLFRRLPRLPFEEACRIE